MNRIATLVLGVMVVALLLGFASVAMADEAKGTIKSVDADKGTVTVTVDGKDMTCMVAKDCKITVAGKEAKIGDLKKDAKVTVTYKKDGDKIVASAIAAS
jgi:Cu/Ag efflux protein CusF